MCTPQTLMAIGTVLYGHKLKSDAASSSRAKQKSLTGEELARQTGYETEARGKQNTAVNQFSKPNVESEIQGQTQRLASLYNDGVGGQVHRSPMIRSNDPEILAGHEDAAFQQAGDEARARGEQMAGLNSFGRSMTSLAPALQDASRAQALSSSMASGSADALKRELLDAQNAAYSPLGDLMTSLGMVGANASLKKPKVIT